MRVDVRSIDLDAVRDTSEALRADVAPSDVLHATKAADPVLGRHRLVGLAVLRRILARYQNGDPAMPALRSRPFGKLMLDEKDHPPLAFNMSRSRNMPAIAVAKCDSLGIELEHEAGPVAGIAASVFSRAELISWAALPASQ